MDNKNVEYLEQRIKTLENGNRKIYILCTFILFGFIFIVSTGSKKNITEDIIKVRKLSIVDGKGNEIVGIGNNGDDDPSIHLRDKKGNIRFGIDLVNGTQPTIYFMDDNKTCRAVIKVDKNGNSNAYFADNNYYGFEIGVLNPEKKTDNLLHPAKKLGFAIVNPDNGRLVDLSIVVGIPGSDLGGLRFYDKQGNRQISLENGSHPYLTIEKEDYFSSTMGAGRFDVNDKAIIENKSSGIYSRAAMASFGVSGLKDELINMTLYDKGLAVAYFGESYKIIGGRNVKTPISSITLGNGKGGIKWGVE